MRFPRNLSADDVISNSHAGKVAVAVALVACAAMFLASSVFTVQSGTRSLVFSAGKLTSVAGEGLHFRIPVYQDIMNIPVTTLKADERAEAASSDLQVVRASISVNFHFDESKLAEIYQQTHFDVLERIIKPRIQESMKAVAAKHTAEELIVSRAVAKQEIDNILKAELQRYNIIVEDVQLTHFQFSPEFDRAIEAKQTEAQNALKAKNILERTKIESEERVVQAKAEAEALRVRAQAEAEALRVRSQAEAEAIRIQSEAIRNQGGTEYVHLRWIEKWNGQPPSVVSGEGASSFILNTAK